MLIRIVMPYFYKPHPRFVKIIFYDLEKIQRRDHPIANY